MTATPIYIYKASASLSVLQGQYTVRSESRRALTLRYVDLVVSIKLPWKCADVSLYSVVKQPLNCNTGKVCNCLIQFLLTMVLWTSLPIPFASAQRLSKHSAHSSG
jgi:hypothetical protein